MVSVLRNLKPVTKNKPFLPVFIPLWALNIYYEMSVPARFPGSFRRFHTHFKPMPPLKNFKDPLCRLWCHVALTLASAGRGRSKGTVLFFSLYFPLVFKQNYVTWLTIKSPLKTYPLRPSSGPGDSVCSTQGWEYCSTKGLCSRLLPGSSGSSDLFTFNTKDFPDSPLQTNVRFPACSSFCLSRQWNWK